MNENEVRDIADAVYMSPLWGAASIERMVKLCNEVERRTLERAAVVCDDMVYHSDDEALGQAKCASKIRALKEEV